MTVTARSIVEAINVISYLGDRQRSILVDLLLDSLLLQAAEEGLGDGIVPAVAFPAHTRLEANRPTESPPGVAAVLGSLIGMRAQRMKQCHVLPLRRAKRPPPGRLIDCGIRRSAERLGGVFVCSQTTC